MGSVIRYPPNSKNMSHRTLSSLVLSCSLIFVHSAHVQDSSDDASHVIRAAIAREVNNLRDNFVQPGLSFIVNAFSVFGILEIILTVISGVADPSMTVKANIISVARKLFKIFLGAEITELFKYEKKKIPILGSFKKLFSDDMGTDQHRRRRDIEEFEKAADDAFQKYNSLQHNSDEQ